MDGQPPSFMEGTFIWDRRGYRLATMPSEDLTSDRSLASADAWIVLASVLEHAKLGDRSAVGRLAGVLVPESPPMLIRGAVALLADAGTDVDWSALRSLLTGRSDYLRLEACWAIRSAGHLSLVPDMLRAWSVAERQVDRESIGFGMSSLLEAEPGAVASPEEYSRERYMELVSDAFVRLRDSIGGDAAQVWRGRAYDVPQLAEKMWEMCFDKEVDLEDLRVSFLLLRHRFEAATGWDCTEFYDNRRIDPNAIASVIGSFLEGLDENQYRPGVRYSFGHPIV